MDYVIENFVNIVPNLLRYQIMDALEAPIKMRVQEELNAINVEKVIHENLSKLDNNEIDPFNEKICSHF